MYGVAYTIRAPLFLMVLFTCAVSLCSIGIRYLVTYVPIYYFFFEFTKIGWYVPKLVGICMMVIFPTLIIIAYRQLLLNIIINVGVLHL